MQQKEEKKEYLKNKVMLAELVACQSKGVMSNKLGEMFILLSERYAKHRYFSRYDDIVKEELIGYGILACVRGWEKFNPELYDNPFAFFTTTIHRGFIQYLKKHYKQSNIKNELKSELGLDPDYGYVEMMNAQEEEKHESESIDDIRQDDALFEDTYFDLSEIQTDDDTEIDE